jgi:fatty-acyl-CoA synthase
MQPVETLGIAAEIPPSLLEAAAQRLDAQGVVPGAIVAWLSHNRWEMLAALAECERRGAVLLPLNWRLAAAELVRIVAHSGAGHLLSEPETQALADAVSAQNTLRPGPAQGVERGDLLLVYTSGTTGEPKGAMHTRWGMVANVDAALHIQDLTPSDRILAVLPLFHVGGLCIQTLPALSIGASVRLHAKFDPGAWLDDVAGWRPSTSLLVPAAMRAVIEHPRWATADLSSLRFVNCGSQVVPLHLIEAFHARGVPVTQVYGATETGPVSIALHPRDALAHAGQVGWPAPGVQVQLASDGEICLKAPNLMRGYHRHAEPSFDAESWFHTGDLAERDARGCYRVVGRSKELIISGGENIYPAEIENLVASLPEVADCAVLGLPDARWGEVPVLVVVLRSAAGGIAPQPPGNLPNEFVAPDAGFTERLRGLFQERLARFKHPQRVVCTASLPRTALGKVQKPALGAALAAWLQSA